MTDAERMQRIREDAQADLRECIHELEAQILSIQSCPPWAATLTRIRKRGWTVAVHNDYRQGGTLHTFWLFTKGNRCVKGEGLTDAGALADAFDKIEPIELANADMLRRFTESNDQIQAIAHAFVDLFAEQKEKPTDET